VDIQPIQTKYARCLFRSRLEARWAVFFDLMGIEWEYEPEGYVLSDGIWYLPDFWLPTLKLWVEVKPSCGASKEEINKIELLSCGGEWATSLFCGQPNSWHESFFFAFDFTDGSAGDYSIDGQPIPWGFCKEIGPTLCIDKVDSRVLRDREIYTRSIKTPLPQFCYETNLTEMDDILYLVSSEKFEHRA